MFLTLQIPLADARPFVPQFPARVGQPDWKFPLSESFLSSFVRHFGSPSRRTRKGLTYWHDEHHYCQARQSFKFVDLYPGDSPSPARPFPLIRRLVPQCGFRHFHCATPGSARFEVCLREAYPKPEAAQTLTGTDCGSLAEEVLNLSIRLRRLGPAVPAACTLRDFPRHLPRQYDHATRPRKPPAGGDPPPVGRYIRAGRPLFLLEYPSAEIPELPAKAQWVMPRSPAGVGLAFIWHISRGVPYPFWLLCNDAADDAGRATVQQLRIGLHRLHAEMQAMAQILDLFRRRVFPYAPETAEAGAFDAYLLRAARYLSKGTDPVLAAIREPLAALQVVAEDEQKLLKAALSEVRRQVAAKALEYLSTNHSVAANGPLDDTLFNALVAALVRNYPTCQALAILADDALGIALDFEPDVTDPLDVARDLVKHVYADPARLAGRLLDEAVTDAGGAADLPLLRTAIAGRTAATAAPPAQEFDEAVDGPKRKQIRTALLNAFPDYASLECFARTVLATSLSTVTSERYDQAWITFKLIHWAKSGGKLKELAVGMATATAGAAQLNCLAAEFRAVPPARSGDERIVREDVQFENALEWLDHLGRACRAVCRVEPQPQDVLHYATGFLVAPDVVMTNYHVVEWFRGPEADRVVFRFDYETDRAGLKVAAGREYKLAPDWFLTGSSELELDFALVRLSEAAGDEVTGGERRGVLKPEPHPFRAGSPLLVVQHPDAMPLKLSFGSISDLLNPVPNRVAHTVNTLGGSSGSPCFTAGLQLVALHKGWDKVGGVEQNLGIPFQPIVDFLVADKDKVAVAKGLTALNDSWARAFGINGCATEKPA